jgi:hypothetical protein
MAATMVGPRADSTDEQTVASTVVPRAEMMVAIAAVVMVGWTALTPAVD